MYVRARMKKQTFPWRHVVAVEQKKAHIGSEVLDKDYTPPVETVDWELPCQVNKKTKINSTLILCIHMYIHTLTYRDRKRGWGG